MALRIYQDALVMVREAYQAAEVIGRRDPDLARQLRRAASSVALNLAEGSHSLKGNRPARYATAMGSADESRAVLQVAAATGMLAQNEALLDRVDKIVATLWKLTR